MGHIAMFLASSLTGWVLTTGGVIIWVWAEVRALMRGQMLWLVIITFTGPFGALAYLAGTVAGDTTRAGYVGGASQWPPSRR